jgi:hypothetical protein
LTFILDRHPYFALEADAREAVFPGRSPLAEQPATAEEAGRLADFLDGDSLPRRLAPESPDFFDGPAVTGLAFFFHRSVGFRVGVPELPTVPPPSRNRPGGAA